MIRNLKIRCCSIAAILVAAIVCAQIAIADEATTTEDSYLAAQKNFDARRWADAIKSIRAAIEAQPDDPRANPIRMYLAEALLREGRSAEAAKEYHAFLETSDDPQVRVFAEYRLIESLFFAEDYAAVVDLVPEFFDKHPRHEETPRVRYYLGMASFVTQDFAAAEAAMARLTAEFPESELAESAAHLQAMSLLHLGRPSAAWTVLCSILPASPGRFDDCELAPIAGQVLSAVGEEAIHAELFDDAEASFDRLLEWFPKHERAPSAALRRAEISHQRGEFATAAKRFAAVIERGDLDAEMVPHARIQRLLCLAELQRWDDVLTFSESAKKQHGEWVRAYEFDYLRGRALFAKAELNDARAAFTAVASSPAAAGTEAHVLAHYMTAETYALQRNYDAALVGYEAAATGTFPHWRLEARMQCGKLRERLGRFEEAARDYERVTLEFSDLPESEEAERRRAACTAQAAVIKNLERK